jgi:polyferredoxin
MKDTKTRQRLRRGLVLVSFLLFPVTMYYFSPYLIIEGAAAGIVSGSMIMFGLQFASSLVAGRAFCGWVCPAAGLQEACALARDRRLGAGKRWIKYAIWVPWIAGIAFAVYAAGGLRAVDPFLQIDGGVSIASPEKYVVFYGFIVLIAGLAFTAGRRAFCRYVCWMAPFMVIGRKIRNAGGWPSLRIVADEGSCKQCRRCNRACQQSLDVRGLVAGGSMEDAECILCGACVDSCPNGALRYGFSSGTASPARATQGGGDAQDASQGLDCVRKAG